MHFQLAARVLDAWPDPNEFDPSDTQVRNAFLNGSIGPDMGFYPGGFTLPTDLAHYLSTGALARSLVNEARTELERAYAWGWVTHILADVELHPLVNQGAGELLTGDRQNPRTYAEDPTTHTRVEIGLDAFFQGARAGGGTVSLRPVFDHESIQYLQRVFQETYGVEFETAQLLRSHLAVVKHHGLIQGLNRVAYAVQRGRVPAFRDLPLFLGGFLPARLASRLFARRSVVFGLTNTVKPSHWLIEEVDGVKGRFVDLFVSHYSDRIASLPDFNLDTGEVETGDALYPLTERTRRRLAKYR